jgi:hypothetical protein
MNGRLCIWWTIVLLPLAAGCQAGAVEAERLYDNALGEIMYLVPADISLDPHHFVIASECRTHNGYRQGLSQDSIHNGGMLWLLQFLETHLTPSC